MYNILCLQIAQPNFWYENQGWERDFYSELLSGHVTDYFKGCWIKWSGGKSDWIFVFFNKSRNKNDGTFYVMDNLWYCVFYRLKFNNGIHVRASNWTSYFNFHCYINFRTFGISKCKIIHTHTHTTHTHTPHTHIHTHTFPPLLQRYIF